MSTTSTPTAGDQQELLAIARALADAGFALVPIGSKKKPAMPKGFMALLASDVTEVALRAFREATSTGMRVELGVRGARQAADGLALVPLAFEFEGKAPEGFGVRVSDAVARLEGEALFARLDAGWAELTPGGSGGRRWFFQLALSNAESVSDILKSLDATRALADGAVVAELLSASAIVAPSFGETHPTGSPYLRVEGSEGPAGIPTLTVSDLRFLGSLLYELSDATEVNASAVALPQMSQFSRQVANHYRLLATPTDSLAQLIAAGWSVKTGALPAEVGLSRPGSVSGDVHALIGGERRPNGELNVFTTSDGTLHAGFYPAFLLLAALRFRGDSDAAATKLVADGVVSLRARVLAAARRREVFPKFSQSTALLQAIVDAAVKAENPNSTGDPLLLRKETASGTPMFLLSANVGGDPVVWGAKNMPSLLLAVVQPIERPKTDDSPAIMGHGFPPAIVEGVGRHLMTNAGPAPVVVTATEPVLLESGRVLTESRYHRAERVLISIGLRERAAWAASYHVPKRPTHEDAQDSLDFLLREFFVDFPFATPGDRARAVALLLTMCVRHLMDRAPGFILDAADRGSGKSLLAELMRIVARGTSTAAVISADKRDDEENRKAIVAALLAGEWFIVVDELPRGERVTSKLLSEMLTAADGTFKYRILGGNTSVPLSGLTLTIAGNNVEPGADFNRRLFPIRLVVNEGIAHERGGFHHDNIRRWVQANRIPLLAAVHTIVLFGIQNPPSSTPNVGSFEDWSRVVLGALSPVTLEDGRSVTDHVMQGRAKWTAARDETADEWGPFVAWAATRFAEKWVTVKEMREHLKKAKTTAPDLPSPLRLATTDSESGANRSWAFAFGAMRDTAIPWAGAIYRLRVIQVKGGREASRYRIEAAPMTDDEVPTVSAPTSPTPAEPLAIASVPAAAVLRDSRPTPTRPTPTTIREIEFK
jgi:hypothetical protein